MFERIHSFEGVQLKTIYFRIQKLKENDKAVLVETTKEGWRGWWPAENNTISCTTSNYKRFFFLLFLPENFRFHKFFHLDINELNLPRTCTTNFPDPNDLLNFKMIICPDEGYYKGGRFSFNFKVSAISSWITFTSRGKICK